MLMGELRKWAERNHDQANDLLGHKGAFETCSYPVCALAREDDEADKCTLEGRELQVAVIEQARAERDVLFPDVLQKMRRLLTVVGAIRVLERNWQFEPTTVDRKAWSDISELTRRLRSLRNTTHTRASQPGW